jgi:hypothetical protein
MPALKMITSPTLQWSSMEKRKLSDFPDLPSTPLKIQTYFSQLENYLRDHFGYREEMIHRYYRELEKHFDLKRLNSQVVKGQDDWYYLAISKGLDDFMGKVPLSAGQLKKWQTEQLEREAWLKNKKIRYFLVIPSNKTSIYPEHLPKDILTLKGTSRYEQLLDYVKLHPVPAFIDLRQPLLDAKSEGQLYYRTDTHWNMRGALVAFRAIEARLQQSFHNADFFTDFPLSGDILRPCIKTPLNCDLARMILHHEEAFDTYPTLLNGSRCAKPIPIKRYGFSQLTDRPDAKTFAMGCNRKHLVALVFRDSFFVALQPYFTENFKEIIYVWEDFSKKRVEEVLKTVHPDVVIVETVERNAFETIVAK